MATNMFLFNLIWLALIGSNGYGNRHLLIDTKSKNLYRTENLCRNSLLKIAQNELGVREETGRNDGKRIAEYLSAVGLKNNEPWCAAFISWVFRKSGFKEPRSGWSPDLFPSRRLVRCVLPGNLIGIYFPQKKRIAHVGLIEKQDGDWILSIEGNTNTDGSREGDGVYRKRRHYKTIYKIADWITQ